MAKVVKFLLLVVVVAAMVWLATLWQWHVHDKQPNAAELVVYLVAVPIVLTLGLVIGVWQVKKLRAFASVPLVVPQPARSAQTPPTPSALPSWSLVLAAEGASRLGAEWDVGQQATASGEHRPELHAQLVDNQGFAAFVAQVPTVSVDETRDAWEAFLGNGAAQTHQASAWSHPPDDWYRAMTLLSPLVANRLTALRSQWVVLSANLGQVGGARSAQPLVRIELGVPAHWQPIWQQAAEEWVRHQMTPCIEEGLKAAGQSSAMANTPQAVIHFQAHPVEDAAAFWGVVEQRQRLWLENGVPGLTLVLISDSLLSQSLVSALDGQQGLMTACNNKGRVPGEAAAALLMATPAWLDSPDYPGTPALARLYLAHTKRRDHSADVKVSVGKGGLLPQLIQDALAAQKVAVDSVKHLTIDADHRGSRQVELHEVFDTFTELDADKDILCSGLACGDTGVARWLFTLALAVNKVEGTHEPGLVLGNFDEWQRVALLLTPEPFNEATDDSASESPVA